MGSFVDTKVEIYAPSKVVTTVECNIIGVDGTFDAVVSVQCDVAKLDCHDWLGVVCLSFHSVVGKILEAHDSITICTITCAWEVS